MFISKHKKSFFKKILGAKDSKLVTKVESYIQKLRDVECRMQTLYSIEVDAKIDQQDKKIDKMLSFMTISTNTSDINPKVSEVTENRKSEDDNEEYDVNMIVDGADNEIIEEDNEYLEKDIEIFEEDNEIIEVDNETNEVDDEGDGVTLDQMLSIKSATRLDMKG